MRLPGWTRLSACVYQHEDGTRIHAAGLVFLPSGATVWGNSWPISRDMNRAIAMCGGNRRRGIMCWARRLVAAETSRLQSFPLSAIVQP